ncbi:hypothetical protein Bbelb_256730 [Branchiostoma belcheri]|nr:hypothetical protein Bbelb_256730 [Branchiostoma belcheri]
MAPVSLSISPVYLETGGSCDLLSCGRLVWKHQYSPTGSLLCKVPGSFCKLADDVCVPLPAPPPDPTPPPRHTSGRGSGLSRAMGAMLRLNTGYQVGYRLPGQIGTRQKDDNTTPLFEARLGHSGSF